MMPCPIQIYLQTSVDLTCALASIYCSLGMVLSGEYDLYIRPQSGSHRQPLFDNIGAVWPLQATCRRLG